MKKPQSNIINLICENLSNSYEFLPGEHHESGALFFRHKKEHFYIIVLSKIEKKNIDFFKQKYSEYCIFVFPNFFDNYFSYTKLNSICIQFYFYKTCEDQLIFYDRLFFPYFFPMARRKIDLFYPKFVKRQVFMTRLSPIFLQRLKNDLYFKGDYLDLNFERIFFKNLFLYDQKSSFRLLYNLLWEFFLKKFCK